MRPRRPNASACELLLQVTASPATRRNTGRNTPTTRLVALAIVSLTGLIASLWSEPFGQRDATVC